MIILAVVFFLLQSVNIIMFLSQRILTLLILVLASDRKNQPLGTFFTLQILYILTCITGVKLYIANNLMSFVELNYQYYSRRLLVSSLKGAPG